MVVGVVSGRLAVARRKRPAHGSPHLAGIDDHPAGESAASPTQDHRSDQRSKWRQQQQNTGDIGDEARRHHEHGGDQHQRRPHQGRADLAAFEHGLLNFAHRGEPLVLGQGGADQTSGDNHADRGQSSNDAAHFDQYIDFEGRYDNEQKSEDAAHMDRLAHRLADQPIGKDMSHLPRRK